MEKIFGKNLKHGFLNLFLATEIVCAIDLLLLMYNIEVSITILYPLIIVLWLIFNRVLGNSFRSQFIIVIILPIVVAFIVVIGYFAWKIISKNMQYTSVDSGKSQVYGNQSVMVIVPHEDDEINLAGGVLEQYVKYGSEVRVVFVTNGDYLTSGETRIKEAIQACAYMGIDEAHVIFLGYGDNVNKDGLHIYDAEMDHPYISGAGYSKTYGLAFHPAYTDGNLYTKANLISDFKSVILKYRPNTILCSDFDLHIDHRATSLIFERAMGEILRETSDYRPTVLKGFAYESAWYAKSDYYAPNILSTENVFIPENLLFPDSKQVLYIYPWEERIRLPINAETVSRSLVNSRAYAALQKHSSQEADKKGSSVVNGDRVFWERRTDSLLYTAVIDVSSNEAQLLNDFMLIDSICLANDEHSPYDGTWIPAKDDPNRTVTVRFEKPTDVYELVLFDNPSKEDNVLNAEIVFDQGAVFETGALSQTGGGASYIVNQEDISSFTITLKALEGKDAGLTEIEAYAKADVSPFAFVKLMDQEENLAYDYVMNRTGMESFSLYTYGKELPELSSNDYSVFCNNAACSATIQNDLVEVRCPSGEGCTIELIFNDEPTVSEHIYVQNPTFLQRAAIHYVQQVEQFAYNGYTYNAFQRSLFLRTPVVIQDGTQKVFHMINA